MPEYKDDLLKVIADLRAEVSQLRAMVQQRSALTTASGGWILPNMPVPDPPADGARIYANGNEFYAILSTGDIRDMVPQVFPQGVAVANPANFTSGTIGGTPTAAQYNALRADAVEIRAQLIALLASLRTPAIILT